MKGFSIVKALMYAVLIGYALISVFPFLWMLSASLMTLGEVTNSSYLLPRGINSGTDISDCILYARNVQYEGQGQDFGPVSSRKLIIDIPDAAADEQGYGLRSASANLILLNPLIEDGTFSADTDMSDVDAVYDELIAAGIGTYNTNNNFFSRIDEDGDLNDRPIVREEIWRLPFFSNYCAAWKGGNLGQYMINTVKLTLITVSGTLIFATLTAYAFARMDFVGKNVVFAIMLATLMIPGIVQNLPNFILVTRIGEFFGNEGWIFERFGVSLCGDERNCWMNNWPALTIPFMAPAISIFLLRQHFATIPNELWDAARIDGTGHFRFLIQIVLPLSRAALFVVLLFAFIGSWNDLAWPILVTSGDTWRPIAVGLQEFQDAEGSFPHLQMAGNMIAIIPILLLYAVTQRTFIEGLSSSGLKG